MSMTTSSSFINNVQSRYGKRKKKKKIKVEHLKHLSRDDLKYELIKEKKKRIGDKKKYQRESRKLHDKFTIIADEYEDQIKENENEMKQEYEAKLIEAEIKKKELEQEVQRLKQQLLQQQHTQHSMKSAATDDSGNNVATLGAISTSSPRPGAITITSPQIYNNHNNHVTPITSTTPLTVTTTPLVSIPGGTVSHNNHNTNDIQYETPKFSAFGSSYGTPSIGINITPPLVTTHPFTFNENNIPQPITATTLERKEASDEGVNVMTRDSMDDKLKMTMSPSLKQSTHQLMQSFADITQLVTFPETQEIEQQEGSDDDMDKGIVIMDRYSNYNDNHHDNININNNHNRIELDNDTTDSDDSRSSNCSVTPSPEPPKRKKRTKKKPKKKRKRMKQESSFWDILIKCMTPSVCEAEQ